MRKQWILIVVLLGAFCVQAEEGKVYTWTDEQGVVHFSDTPYPEKDKYEIKEVRVDVTPHASSGPIITPRAPLKGQEPEEKQYSHAREFYPPGIRHQTEMPAPPQELVCSAR